VTSGSAGHLAAAAAVDNLDETAQEQNITKLYLKIGSRHDVKTNSFHIGCRSMYVFYPSATRKIMFFFFMLCVI
jgi:hypothetical protein